LIKAIQCQVEQCSSAVSCQFLNVEADFTSTSSNCLSSCIKPSQTIMSLQNWHLYGRDCQHLLSATTLQLLQTV